MCRNSVLFPQPLPPMMMKISPRRICALMSRIRTNEPKAIVRSRISILMSPLGFTGQMCSALQITAKRPSDAMIQVMPVTTAEVVAWPTAAALVPH